jgi:hypothetical protein
LVTSFLFAGTALAMVSAPAEASPAPVQASCHLQSAGNKIKRVVYLQFDNVHLRRDNPNVPSVLEQMPHLLNFLQDNGYAQRQSLHTAYFPYRPRHRAIADRPLR